MKRKCGRSIIVMWHSWFNYRLLNVSVLNISQHSLQGYEEFILSLVVNPCTQNCRGKINNGAVSQFWLTHLLFWLRAHWVYKNVHIIDASIWGFFFNGKHTHPRCLSKTWQLHTEEEALRKAWCLFWTNRDKRSLFTRTYNGYFSQQLSVCINVCHRCISSHT